MQYLLLVVLSYLGLGVGVLISYFAKEEIKPGQKYFRIAKQVVFAAIFYLFLDHLMLEKLFILGLVFITTILSYVWDNRMRFVNADWFYYSFFAVVMYEIRLGEQLLNTSILIFIFGIIAASIKMKKLLKKTLYSNFGNLLMQNSLYILLSLVLLLIKI